MHKPVSDLIPGDKFRELKWNDKLGCLVGQGEWVTVRQIQHHSCTRRKVHINLTQCWDHGHVVDVM